MADIGRLLTAMVTPFHPRGGVNYGMAGRLANALTDSGSDGIVVAGTTGESPTLSPEEKLRLFSEVRKAASGRGAVVAGTGSNSTAESIKLTRYAEAAGVDGVLLVVPYYNKPTPEGLYQHFRAIAESTRLPCILYNVPGRTSLNMMAETTLRLAHEIPNIVGIKEASGNMAQVAHIINGAPEGFHVWSGNDQDTFDILTLGGYGVISVISHLVGLQVREMVSSKVPGDLEDASKASQIHNRLLPLVEACFRVSNPIPIKYALNQLGWQVGKPRLPLLEPDEETGEQIMVEVLKHKIDLLVP
ncbi:MAG: 4-hydroxy-tetrahydrodipicolinate synthase [bacterium]|nr:4-hydroxy-tetrahydrodipicolinate synthase [bacterium]